MNIYKAPNLIISPKRKVYGVGGGGRRIIARVGRIRKKRGRERDLEMRQTE